MLAIDDKSDRTKGLRVSRFNVIPGEKPDDAIHVDMNSEQDSAGVLGDRAIAVVA